MSDFEIFDMPQGSPEWFQARLGIPTASEFDTIQASGRGGGVSKTRQTYMRKLAGEVITGLAAESFQSAAFDRGHEWESIARTHYEFSEGVEVQEVGFIRSKSYRAGGSPDGLVGADGMIEIKTKAPHLWIEAVERGSFPPEHMAQTQGNLWISGREWCDLVIYYQGMPLIISRIERDEGYIRGLRNAVTDFNVELLALVGRIQELGKVVRF